MESVESVWFDSSLVTQMADGRWQMEMEMGSVERDY